MPQVYINSEQLRFFEVSEGRMLGLSDTKMVGHGHVSVSESQEMIYDHRKQVAVQLLDPFGELNLWILVEEAGIADQLS